MCGIAGIVSAQTSTNDWVIVKRMTDALRHRGPDALDVVQTDSGVFGHTRLAIIDLDASANQPMFDERRRYVIVYNGELYNYRELKKQLPDWRFRTQSDTEVVLAAFALWGESCVERFNGMFAFAIWTAPSAVCSLLGIVSANNPCTGLEHQKMRLCSPQSPAR